MQTFPVENDDRKIPAVRRIFACRTAVFLCRDSGIWLCHDSTVAVVATGSTVVTAGMLVVEKTGCAYDKNMRRN